MNSGAPGVNLVGYVHEHSGLGEIARLLLASLETAGFRTAVVPVGPRPLRERLRTPDAPFETSIVCVNPDVLPTLVESLGRAFFRDRRTIGFWWWEVDSLPPVLAWAGHLVDEVWVGSQHVRSAVAARVGKPVHVFPVPLIRPEAARVHRPTFGIPDDRFTFAFSFNFSSSFDRKNPLGLVDAFTRAFAADEGPVLVLKSINSGLYAGELGRLRKAIGARRDIVLVDRPLEPAVYHGLVAACDAYASLHRAEGLGLTIAEAMTLGKPAVATAYSGNLEFMDEDNSYLIPYGLVPIPPGMPPYPVDAHWADPDVDAAARILREIVDHPEEASARGEKARRNLEERHGTGRAAAFVEERLAQPSAPRTEPTDPVERAAYELMWGPDLELARPWARQLRQVARPFLRPYLDHQRRVGALVLDAARAARVPDEDPLPPDGRP